MLLIEVDGELRRTLWEVHLKSFAAEIAITADKLERTNIERY